MGVIHERLADPSGNFGVMILDHGRLVGALSGERIARHLAQPYVRELYYRKAITQWLDHHGCEPTVLLAETSISDAIQVALARTPSERFEPLVVTDAEGGTMYLLKVEALLVEQCRLLLDTLVELERQRSLASEAETQRSAMHKRLLDASREAGRAEVATGVLHNVGNVLNSLNMAAGVILRTVQQSKVANLAKAAELLQTHEADLPAFLTRDDRGRVLPGYLAKLAQTLTAEQQTLTGELATLTHGLEHVKQIVHMQQSYSTSRLILEPTRPADVMEDALRVNLVSFDRHSVMVVRQLADLPPVLIDKHRVLQILINLISNAKNATKHHPAEDRTIWVRVQSNEGCGVRFQVADNGVGIPAENLTRVFALGFTTRREGHGFGLHSAANTAKEMGGSLTAHSDGKDRGATFTLDLPLIRSNQVAA